MPFCHEEQALHTQQRNRAPRQIRIENIVKNKQKKRLFTFNVVRTFTFPAHSSLLSSFPSSSSSCSGDLKLFLVLFSFVQTLSSGPHPRRFVPSHAFFFVLPSTNLCSFFFQLSIQFSKEFFINSLSLSDTFISSFVFVLLKN